MILYQSVLAFQAPKNVTGTYLQLMVFLQVLKLNCNESVNMGMQLYYSLFVQDMYITALL